METPKAPWTLRLRGPKGGPSSLEVPSGGDATLKDLVKLSAKAVKIAQKRVVIKYGFPPKEVAEEATTIAGAGIRDRDTIVIERRKDLDVFDDAKGGLRVSGASKASTSASRSPGGPASPISKSGKVRIDKHGTVKRRQQPKPRVRHRVFQRAGVGHVLGTSADPTGGSDPNDAFVLGRAVGGHDAAMSRIGADLVAAGSGSGATDALKSSALRSLRQTFRAARVKLEQRVEAEDKVAACMAARYRFEPLNDDSGRMRCVYTKTGGRKEREECVSDIPSFLLKAILKQIASDKDQVQLDNLQPVSMALVSPRVFWSVVKHGKVGPGVSFVAALASLVPEVNWQQIIEERKRAKPEKYGDYVPH